MNNVVNLEKEKSKHKDEIKRKQIDSILTNLIELNKCGRLDDIDVIFKIDNEDELIYTGVKKAKSFDRVDLVKKAKPDKVNDMQIGEIRQVKDNLENSAREII